MSKLHPPYVHNHRGKDVPKQRAAFGADLPVPHGPLSHVGIYIGVFMVTIYIYGIRGKQNRSYNKFISASLVLLFLITLTSMILRWHLMDIIFCNHGNTQFSIAFIDGTYALPPSLDLLLSVTEMANFFLADFALLWRYFHACGGTLTTSFVLLAGLFIVEIALAITALAFAILTQLSKPDIAKLLIYGKVSNQISGAAYIAIAVTNSMATFLICKTIYSHTTHNRSARKRLSHVVYSLTQSCGIYTAITIIQAVVNLKSNSVQVYDINNPTTLTVAGLGSYSTSLICATSGLIPTLMVARLATASDPTEIVDTDSEPASSAVSIPLQLGDHPDPERASIDAVHGRLDKTPSSGGVVGQDSSIIVEESRGRRILGRDEEC
ncbi:hypothetical protein D9613_012040 [Agrocybe pediades]|uniref:Uncharacterized protein n=1 Tax=Agrocybe pediades TaxID=84607 RepID=A0A8H4VHD1_9AGAR|nr:hypothetical protein D9613_012040 [Agrocybe pediades]